jgi:hypothetical protein
MAIRTQEYFDSSPSRFFVRCLRETDALRPLYLEAEYRQRRLDQNSRGFLAPLDGLRVRL